MTKRERFLAFANFEPVDRIPRHASYVEDLRQRMEAYLGQDPYAYFDMDTGGGAGLTPPEGFTRPDYSIYHQEWRGNEHFSIDGNGCGHLNHGFYHFTEYISPLRNAARFEEIESYPIVSNAGWSDTRMRQAGEEAHAAGTYSSVFVGHMYENAWQVRGYEEFLMDLLTQREWAESILDRYCDNNVRTAEAAARAGYDMISTGDDVASQQALMFQPEIWRAVMKPRWAKVIAAARAIKPDIHVWYHSDGNIWDILDDLIEIGITIHNPVQPECMNPFDVRKRCGKRLAFDGCVGTQSTFPFGTPPEMRQVVRELVDGLDGRQGGLMLSPTHVLEPEVPPANIVEFFDEIERIALGWRKEDQSAV
ncbi:MAG: uroporphyrinogen decarboxylase family protein [Armatimonadota bacterium]